MDPLSNLTDSQLAMLAVKGNDQALSELIARHLPGIYSFLARMAGPDAADDLAQETFVKAWKNLRKFDPSRSMKTWLYAIAKNTAYDWLRKHHPDAMSSFEDSEGRNSVTDSLADREKLQDELAMTREDAVMIQKAIAKLPAHYRAVILLRYEEDLSFEEISQVLGKPLETLRSQHRRALMLLRSGMKNAPN